MSLKLLQALYRGGKQTLALIEKECDMSDPEVRVAHAKASAEVEKWVKEIETKKR
ncbi:hypothetical protein IAD21_00884 [Abditibacteriota bacterium]|nr:hypothetical protein IAD21_00884 [Abditibacteriota bacterium]